MKNKKETKEVIEIKNNKNTGNSLEYIVKSVLFFKNYDIMYKHIKKLNNSIFNQIDRTNLNISFLTFLPRRRKIEKFLDVLNIGNNTSIDNTINSVLQRLKNEKISWIRNILHSPYDVLFASLDDGGKERYADNSSYLIDNDENNVNKFIDAGGHGILFNIDKTYFVSLV